MSGAVVPDDLSLCSSGEFAQGFSVACFCCFTPDVDNPEAPGGCIAAAVVTTAGWCDFEQPPGLCERMRVCMYECVCLHAYALCAGAGGAGCCRHPYDFVLEQAQKAAAQQASATLSVAEK